MATFLQLSLDEKFATLRTQFSPANEPYMASIFEEMMNTAADNKSYDKMVEMGDRVIQQINPYAFTNIAPTLFAGLKAMKWQWRYNAFGYGTICLIDLAGNELELNVQIDSIKSSNIIKGKERENSMVLYIVGCTMEPNTR